MRLLLIALVIVAGCGPTINSDADTPRGDTNGRMFDFISSKPDGSEWVIRVRGDSMWVAYSTRKSDKDLGPKTLTEKEARKLWRLIDAIDLPERDEGEQDEEAGSVQLRLREPTDDGEHEIMTSYVSRETDDEDVIDLASYLIDLIARHHKGVEPAL
jgi:hypothetical protein